MENKPYHCPVEATLDAIGGKWKVLILWHLQNGTKRFSDLQRLMPQITRKMLTQQLRELEHDGLISRLIYQQVPPRVDYSLTEYGQSLFPILQLMCTWGSERIQKLQKEGT